MSGEHKSLVTARDQWIEERVDRYAASLCTSFWHDEGHSCHSSCPSCDRQWMRREEVDLRRRQLVNFADDAEAYAAAIGWTRNA